MKDSLVSVIVPIYKVSAFIREAVDSVREQTYRILEILLVDDGSPDSCPEICDEYSVSDTRIITVHKTNGGLSDARNFGLDLFSGDYVAFLDSDDSFSDSAIQELTENAIAQNADIAVCNVAETDESGNLMRESSYSPLTDRIYSSEEALVELTSERERTMTVVWNKLYKGALWQQIRFPFGKIHEDVFTTYKLLNISARTVTIRNSLYLHRIRSGSIMTTRKAESYECAIEALLNLLDFFSEKKIEQAIVNTDLHCFELIRSAYWSGYSRHPGVLRLTSGFRKKYAGASYRKLSLKCRMFLFWKCPAAERILYFLCRKAVVIWKRA